jgi:anti-sigma B factor antagonist
MFRFEKAERGNTLVLSLFGNLDAMTAAQLKQEVVAISESGRTKVVVDLSTLGLVDSTGVGVLISLFKRVRAQNGHVFFAGLKAQPKEVFRLLRLDKSLDLHPTVDEAVAAIQK